MSELPNYFIQTQDGVLSAYWDRTILLIDLSLHRGERVTVLQRAKGFVTRYVPVSEADLRKSSKVA
jgi:hypothetical protein